MKAMVEAAPKLIDFLGAESLAHFDGLQGHPRRQRHRLHASTRAWCAASTTTTSRVFEFVTDRLGSQGTVCAGGRYDGLIEQLGGKPAPAVGWAIGVERVLELLKEQGTAIPAPAPDAYAVVPDAAAMPVALRTLQQLREAGVRVQMHAATADGLGSFKSQFKKADASGARYALIFGADELARGEVTVKALRDGSGAQIARPLADPAAWAATLQSPAPNN